MFHHKTTGQIHYIKVANKSFKSVVKFIYYGMLVADRNFIHQDLNSRIKPGNSHYHVVQNLLYLRLLPKNKKIKIYRTIILCIPCLGVKLGLLC
jgi:hypothetical protein